MTTIICDRTKCQSNHQNKCARAVITFKTHTTSDPLDSLRLIYTICEDFKSE